MSWLRDLALPVVVIGLLVVGAAPLAAQEGGGSDCTEKARARKGGGGAAADCDADPQPDPGPAPEPPECTPERREDPDAWWLDYDNIPGELFEEQHPYHDRQLPEGKTYAVKRDCEGEIRGRLRIVDEPDWGDIEGLREQVEAMIDLQPPPVQTAPPDANPVVGLEMWLWAPADHWQPVAASDVDGGTTVRVEAVPTSLTFETPEGTRVCDGPGVAWTPERREAYLEQDPDTRGRGDPECTFTFQHPSSSQEDGVHHTSITVAWEFRWWLNGAPRGMFGTVPMTRDLDLTVREYQAVVTDGT